MRYSCNLSLSGNLVLSSHEEKSGHLKKTGCITIKRILQDSFTLRVNQTGSDRIGIQTMGSKNP